MAEEIFKNEELRGELGLPEVIAARIQAAATIGAAFITSDAIKEGSKNIEEGLNTIAESTSKSLDGIGHQIEKKSNFEMRSSASNTKFEIDSYRSKIISLLSSLDEAKINSYFEENPNDGWYIFNNQFSNCIDLSTYTYNKGRYLLEKFFSFLNCQSLSIEDSFNGFIKEIEFKKEEDKTQIIKKFNNLMEDKKIFELWNLVIDEEVAKKKGIDIYECLASPKEFNKEIFFCKDKKNIKLITKTIERYLSREERVISHIYLDEDDCSIFNSYGLETYNFLCIIFYVYNKNEKDFKNAYYAFVDSQNFVGFNPERNSIRLFSEGNYYNEIENANILHFIMNCGSAYGVNKICSFMLELLDIMSSTNDYIKLLDILELNPYRDFINELNKQSSINNTISRLPDCYKKISEKYKLSYFYKNGVFTNNKGQSQDNFNCDRMKNSMLRFYREKNNNELYNYYLYQLKEKLSEIYSKIDMYIKLDNNNALKRIKQRYIK